MRASPRFLAVAVVLVGSAICAAFAVRMTRTPAKTNGAPLSGEAAETRIVRDEWGIAHVHGKTDADAVFGAIYAQAEDDFNRVETNYLNAMGRLAEAEGESAIFQDLRMKLFIDPVDLQARYASSPEWLRRLMISWANGLNLFLGTHLDVHPRVIRRFEPWMALSFTEGSIGGDIEDVPLDALKAFYGAPGDPPLPSALDAGPHEPGGSNGIAIAPSNTESHHALLLINPHTSFFFRSELQMTSDEGLNAYGAVTWGQFFIYQGFNERLGWMHTSSGVDNIDFFEETIEKKDGRYYYRYGREERPVVTSVIDVPYRDKSGALVNRTFTVYRTHHGPIVQEKNGRWVSVALMQKPVEALSQSYLLTKAQTYAEFMKTMELRANSSNNTVYADREGNIAYLHPQFIPKRDDRFDYTHPVDGADPATDWQGLHALDEAPHLFNPPTGWIMNTNDWPYSAAGADSPKRESFPRYMDTAGENPRGVHATILLKDRRDFTADSLNAAAFDSYLPAFARLIPVLVRDQDGLRESSPLKGPLVEPIQVLRDWDYRWSARSVATTLAVLWGDELRGRVKKDAAAANFSFYDYVADHAGAEKRLSALASVCDRLAHDFGTWKVPWGDVNRYQRVTGDIVQRFDDAAPSAPIPFTSSFWGSLASFGAKRYEGTAKYYGTGGNSFVAIVEFGDKVSARAVSIGGESGDPTSAHFRDQVDRYAQGALRKVYFYPADLVGHIERTYRPH